MRRVIAERLQQSKQTLHFYLTVECEIDTFASQKALNEATPEGVKISVNDMVVKAAAAALIVPEVNGYLNQKDAAISVMLISVSRLPLMAVWLPRYSIC